MKCILHIGCENTGSIMIQAWLKLDRAVYCIQKI